MKTTTEIVTKCHELTTAEANTLQACEADINKGGELIATALQKIRDQRLYRAEFSTFEDYCRERLNKSRRWVNQQIMHIEVIANIAEHIGDDKGDLGTMVPKMTERATRELSGLEPEEQAEVVKTIADAGEKPTASTVRRFASQKKADKQETARPATEIVDEVPPEAKPASKPGQEMHDTLGRLIPAHLVESAGLSAQITSVRQRLVQVKKEVNRLAAMPGGEFLPNSQYLDTYDALLKGARFWTACPRCDGNRCNACRDTGFLRHGVQLSAEMKKKLLETGANAEKLL